MMIIKEKIFPNMFDAELLAEAKVELSEDNKISGLDFFTENGKTPILLGKEGFGQEAKTDGGVFKRN